MNKYNLLNLLDGEVKVIENNVLKTISVSGIEIPIIQRDYAQGRKGEEVIRERFLNSLFTALRHDSELELDFVYGSIKEMTTGNNVFLPLDGQQRLTTLFLLYWYVGNRELEGDALQQLRRQLLRFSYSTRSTARTFCGKLAEIGFSTSPAESITESFWFHRIYEKDPTVMSMVNMIRAIEGQYRELDTPIFNRLAKLCFYVLPLDGFNLTDELYIKMNARGKQLTGFENFKADLINWMKDEHKADPGYYLNIASKMDNAWTDIFWGKAKIQEKQEDKVVDNFFLGFINRYLLNEFITTAPATTSLKELEQHELFKYFYHGEENGTALKYRLFKDYQRVLNGDVISRLEHLFDELVIHQEQIRQIIRPVWDLSDDWFLYDKSVSQTQRLLFLGVSLYLEKNTFEEASFKSWIRVVWNVIIDPDIRSIGVMINAMKILKALSPGSGNTYAYLQTPAVEELIKRMPGIFATQLKEEIIKAPLMADADWSEQILSAEAHPLFQGNIRFLIGDRPSLELFVNRLKHAELLFSSSGATGIIKHHGLLRYLISQIDSWKKLYAFTYADSHGNWQLILRRTQQDMELLRFLVSLSNLDAIASTIEQAITTPSTLKSDDGLWDRQHQRTHNALYGDQAFFKWMHDNEAYQMKHLYFHHFIIKPNAHYRKVMISCYRNEIITKLHERYQLDLRNHRCGEADYYWGEAIEVFKNFGEMTVSFHFDNDKNLFVGLKRERNPNLHLEGSGDEQWVQKFRFDYMKVLSEQDASNFITEIIERLTAEETDCIFKKYI
ncbi:DUF262 domain-containing protein [Pedobacter immunditicola]|uniref:DUF262 domain-containing protein n=1 Tax=Pedobacter immunditicola TaxID=3133440 RepID=UPI0030B526AE